MERRKKRSHNIHEALGLQLNAIAQQGGFECLVLAENQGLTVASNGSKDKCEEIAALAPFLTKHSKIWSGNILLNDQIATNAIIIPFSTDLGNLFMCSIGGKSSEGIAQILNGSAGVKRILA